MTADEIRALANVESPDGGRWFLQLPPNQCTLLAEAVAQIAELNAFLREARVMLVRSQGMPPGVPLIGGN